LQELSVKEVDVSIPLVDSGANVNPDINPELVNINVKISTNARIQINALMENA